MNRTLSPSTDKPYGVARVIAVWGLARSSYYAHRKCEREPRIRQKRGPKRLSDEELVGEIRQVLEESVFHGEGYRKVWARLRTLDSIRVSRKRVLRLMREHALLSPHRARTRPETSHERRIITEAPNIMWATDATQVTTVQDGKVWLFGVA